jgi:hypothetical protein
MPNSTVLLVGGRLTSGKDAFADHLVEKHSYVKLGMSDVLAEALYTLDPWVEIYPKDSPQIKKYIRQNWSMKDRIIARLFFQGSQFVHYQDLIDDLGYVDAKTSGQVRSLLQRLGTEVGRNMLGQNIWVDAVKKKIDGLLEEMRNVVVTGIRFPNEIALESAWYHTGPYPVSPVVVASVWIDRPSLRPLDPDPKKRHASEGSVRAEDFEYVLLNDGTLEDLYRGADELLVEIADDHA